MLRFVSRHGDDSTTLLCFKMFDSAGKVRFQEESSSSTGREAYTMCSLFFAPFKVRR